VSSILASLPKFDEIRREPDDAFTAYSYFPPAESALGELVDELLVKNCKPYPSVKQPFLQSFHSTACRLQK